MASPTKTILICDDEDIVREVIEAALAMGGFGALTASNGVDALRLFEADPQAVALAIVDRRMPGMDGAELIVRLRTLRPDLPILLASGAQGADSPIEGLAGRPVRELHKPFRPSELLAAVARELAPGA